MFCDNYFPVSSGNFNLHADGPIKDFPKLLGNDYATEIIYLTNQLIETVLEKYSHVYQIELLTDDTEKTVEFYKSVGFKPANEIGAMSFIKM